jgi:hypothetical protein
MVAERQRAPVADDLDAAARPPRLQRRGLAVVAGAYALSRLAIALTLLVTSAHWRGWALFQHWDGGYYLGIARDGYPRSLAGQSPVAFFPGYPLAIRGLHALVGPLGWSYGVCGVALSLAAGLAASLLVAAAVRELGDERDAVRTGVLFALFPGTDVFSFVYAEAMLLALCALAVLLLARRRWVGAGVAAALAGLCRPSGVYLVVPAAWAAWQAIRERREWRSLAAVALAPLGFAGYLGWLGWRSGRLTAWFEVERQGWHQRLDFGAGYLHLAQTLPWHRAQFQTAVAGAAFLLLVAALALWRRVRLPGLLAAEAAGQLAPLLLFSSLALRPRFLLVAFPLQLVPARALGRRWFAVYACASLVALCASATWHAWPGLSAP